MYADELQPCYTYTNMNVMLTRIFKKSQYECLRYKKCLIQNKITLITIDRSAEDFIKCVSRLGCRGAVTDTRS